MVTVPAPTRLICPFTMMATAVLELLYATGNPELAVAPGGKSFLPNFVSVKASKLMVCAVFGCALLSMAPMVGGLFLVDPAKSDSTVSIPGKAVATL